MHKTTLIAALILAATTSFSVGAQSTGAVIDSQPGKVGIAQAVDVTATISAIDAAKREITLKGPEGREVTMVAGAEVKNFNQLKVGDKVDIQYVEALVLELKKGGGLPVARTENGQDGDRQTGCDSRGRRCAAANRRRRRDRP